MTHVKTSPYYPQSNGKIERWHKTLKGECIRVQVPLSLDDARRIVADYVDHYNTRPLAQRHRLRHAQGQARTAATSDILAERDRKLAEARERRKQLRQARHAATEPQPAVRHAPPSTSPPCAPPSPSPPVLATARLPAAAAPTMPASNAAPAPCTARLHGTSRCFSVNLSSHTFHCFKCGRSGNALDLWAHANRLTHLRRRPRPVPALEHPAAGFATPPSQPRNREEEPVDCVLTKRIVSEVPCERLPRTAVAALRIQFVELNRGECGRYGDSIGRKPLRIIDEEVSRVAERRIRCERRITRHNCGASLSLRGIQNVVIR